MYFPFPERIPFFPVCLFAILLCTVQLYQGTAPAFSLCCFLFIIIAAAAFNLAGGLTRPSGAYIFFFSTLVVLVGLTWKAVLGEPADSNLLVPMTTIKVYLGTICGMFAAVFVSKRLSSRRALLANFVTDDKMQKATIGCMITGLVVTVLVVVLPRGQGTILSALNQLNHFLAMAVFLGVIHTIRRSGHTRSINLPVLLSGGIIFVQGALSFSKEGMITPFVCWALAAASQRYRLSLAQVAGVMMIALFISYYLVPYSQYGRGFRQETYSQSYEDSIAMLSNLGEVRTQFKNEEKEEEEEMLARGYFTHHQGLLDRLQMIGPDDNLNNLTEQGVVPGIIPIYLYFENLIPHFIWPDKPTFEGGNLYARQMGVLAEEDYTTGIAFSPAGESFHLMRWTGVLLVGPILYLILFTLFDSLCGDVRKAPWGLIVLLTFSHIAPEGGLGILISSLSYLTVGILFLAGTVTYLMPLVGELLIGPSKRIVPLQDPISQPPRVSPINPSATLAG